MTVNPAEIAAWTRANRRAALAYRLQPFAFGTDPTCRCGAPAAQGRRECWPCTDSRRAERLARRRAAYARNKEKQQ